MTKKEEKQISKVISFLEKKAPSSLSESWDNVGLLLGTPKATTTGAVVSVDLTEEALELAKQNGFHLIVNHHPCLFPRDGGLSRVTSSHSGTLENRVYETLTQGISVYSSHTNFDRCALEVVEEISKGLGIEPKGRLVERDSDQFLKCVVMVPESHLEQVQKALSEAGAGQIGNYDSCSFYTKGVGTFRGKEGSHPFIGKPGQAESVNEMRLEVILPRGLKNGVLQALKNSHPYEEISYDFYPVEQLPSGKGLSWGLGYGFWGEFDEPKDFSEVALCVKKLFNIDGYWLSEPAPKSIKRLAFVAGKGTSFMSHANQLGCDLFITGEAGYHPVLRSSARGTAVMELGHRESERFYLEVMSRWIEQMGLKVVVSDRPQQRIMSI